MRSCARGARIQRPDRPNGPHGGSECRCGSVNSPKPSGCAPAGSHRMSAAGCCGSRVRRLRGLGLPRDDVRRIERELCDVRRELRALRVPAEKRGGPRSAENRNMGHGCSRYRAGRSVALYAIAWYCKAPSSVLNSSGVAAAVTCCSCQPQWPPCASLLKAPLSVLAAAPPPLPPPVCAHAPLWHGCASSNGATDAGGCIAAATAS